MAMGRSVKPAVVPRILLVMQRQIDSGLIDANVQTIVQDPSSPLSIDEGTFSAGPS
jgi:hypothetical protein